MGLELMPTSVMGAWFTCGLRQQLRERPPIVLVGRVSSLAFALKLIENSLPPRIPDKLQDSDLET